MENNAYINLVINATKILSDDGLLKTFLFLHGIYVGKINEEKINPLIDLKNELSLTPQESKKFWDTIYFVAKNELFFRRRN